MTADIELIERRTSTPPERVLAGDVRNRFVIDGATFAEPKA
ncbi:hypothetical protein [Streptomyces sp. NPDC008137]